MSGRRARAPRRFSPEPTTSRKASPLKRQAKVKSEPPDEDELNMPGPSNSPLFTAKSSPQRRLNSSSPRKSSISISSINEIDVGGPPTPLPFPAEIATDSAPQEKKKRGRGRPRKKQTIQNNEELQPVQEIGSIVEEIIEEEPNLSTAEPTRKRKAIVEIEEACDTPPRMSPEYTRVESSSCSDEEVCVDDFLDEDSALAMGLDLKGSSSLSITPDFQLENDLLINNGVEDLSLLFNTVEPLYTEGGEKYLVAEPDRLPAILKKDNILNMLVNNCRQLHTLHLINDKAPWIPPLTDQRLTFIFFVRGDRGQTPLDMRSDALSPWSKLDRGPDKKIIIRAKTRTIPVRLVAGRYCAAPVRCKDEAYQLHEYVATHPRFPRLKKRIYHFARDGTIFADSMIMYEYSSAGEMPTFTPKQKVIVQQMNQKQMQGALLDLNRSNQNIRRYRDDDVEEEFIEIDGDSMDFTSELDVGAMEETIASDGMPSTFKVEEHARTEVEEYVRSPAPERKFAKDFKTNPFHNELIQMEDGTRCLRSQNVNWCKDKELVLKLIFNDPDCIASTLLSSQKPTLPPLVATQGAYCFFVPVECLEFRDLYTDGLSPWTTRGYHSKTRKIALVENNGVLRVHHTKQWRDYDSLLYEYTSCLGRCSRLRKRICYVVLNDIAVGKVLFSFEYLEDGDLPKVDALKRNKAEQERFAEEALICYTGTPGIPNLQLPMNGGKRKYKRARPFNKRFMNARERGISGFPAPEYVHEEIIEEDIGSFEEEIVVTEALDCDEGSVPQDVDNEMILDSEVSLDVPLLLEDEEECGEWVEEQPLEQHDLPSSVSDNHHSNQSSISTIEVQSAAEAFNMNMRAISVFGSEQAMDDVHFTGVRYNQMGECCVRLSDRRYLLRKDLLLNWMVNHQQQIVDRGLLLNQKPDLPPLVDTADTFLFFVDGHVADIKTINKDMLTPWSGARQELRSDGMSMNRVNSNSKVLKWGVTQAESGEFVCLGHKHAYDPMTQFILIESYIVHYKYPRLRKKVYHIHDRFHDVIVGNVLICYIYAEVGIVPRIEIKNLRLNDKTIRVNDLETPYDLMHPISTVGNSLAFSVVDIHFMYDKKKIIDYIFNNYNNLENNGVLNDHVPTFPPLVRGLGAYVMFIDGTAIDLRSITQDGLGPWSEGKIGDEIFMRPKTKRFALARNSAGGFDLVTGVNSNLSSYNLIVFTATLPRCQRLKKRLFYVVHMRRIVGHAAVFYYYDEMGPLPQPATQSSSHANRMSAVPMCGKFEHKVSRNAGKIARSTRFAMPPMNQWSDDAEFDLHNARIDYCALLDMMRRGNGNVEPSWEVEMQRDEHLTQGSLRIHDSDLTNGPDAIEEVHVQSDHSNSMPQPLKNNIDEAEAPKTMRVPTDLVMEKMRRKLDTIFDFAAYQLGARNENEVLDTLWRVLLMKNEQKLLQNIKEEYGVEIVNEQIIEEEDPARHIEDSKDIKNHPSMEHI